MDNIKATFLADEENSISNKILFIIICFFFRRKGFVIIKGTLFLQFYIKINFKFRKIKENFINKANL